MKIVPYATLSTGQLLALVELEEENFPVRAMEALLNRGDPALAKLIEGTEPELWPDFGNLLWPTVLLGLLAPGRKGAAAAAEVLCRIVGDEVGRMGLAGRPALAVAAAEGLGRIGEAAVPVIRSHLARDSAHARLFLYVALGWIGTEEAGRLLLEGIERDPAVADGVSFGVHLASPPGAIPALHGLLARCPDWLRPEVEGAIQGLARGEEAERPLDRDWRLRYRRSGPYPEFPTDTLGVMSIVRSAGEGLLSGRPVPPVRSLEEILAEPPIPDPLLRTGLCFLCDELAHEGFGFPTCGPEHTAQIAQFQVDVLEGWEKYDTDDLFTVLADAEFDVRTLREWVLPPILGEDFMRRWVDPMRDIAELVPGVPHPEGGANFMDELPEELRELDGWEVDLQFVTTTCRWFVAQGEEDFHTVLARLREAAVLGEDGQADGEGQGKGEAWENPGPEGEETGRRPPAPPAPGPDVASDPDHASAHSMMDQVLEEWLQKRTPHLYGLTPLEARALILGRHYLDGLVREWEEDRTGRLEALGIAYDFRWLREELGVGQWAPEAT